jgi:hypothetical protein
LLHNAQTGSEAHLASNKIRVSPGIKRQWREVDHTPSSSAEVKNVGAIPPLLVPFHSAVLN